MKIPDGLSPVFGYLKTPSMVDFTGHLAAVLFTAGCNFRCGFCHNAQLMGQSRNGSSWTQLHALCRGFADNWVTGAVITGGEPTLSDTLPDLIGLLKSFGWAVKLDTNGSNPEMLRTCLPLVDYVAMDIKTAPSHYPHLTGFDHIESISESVSLIRNHAVDYEFRTTLIESMHTDEHLDEISEFLRPARRYVLQPFVPNDSIPSPHLKAHPRTRPSYLKRMSGRVAHCAEEVLIRGQMS